MLEQVIELQTGRLAVRTERHHEDWPMDKLNVFAARANPKRGFLVVSKVLGRHYPAKPADMRKAVVDLVSQIPIDLPGPMTILGMAETATGLGQAVHAEWHRRVGYWNSIYIQSTRQENGSRIMASFEEGHSHATTHVIHEPTDPRVRDKMAGSRTLILVDDECSTGSTFKAAAQAMVAHLPRLQRIVTVTLTDWSDGNYLASMPSPSQAVSLLSGRMEWQPDETIRHELPPSANGRGVIPKGGTPARFGIFSEADGCTPVRIPFSWRGERLLVLGKGEFTHQALIVGEEAERQGCDVRIQSITRSPVLPCANIADVIHLTDGYGSGAPCFLYNARTRGYDRVVLVAETPGDNVAELAAALGPEIPVELFHCKWDGSR